MGLSPRSLSPSRCDCSDNLWHAAGSGSWWSLCDRAHLHSFLTQFGMYLQLCGSILGNNSFFHIMISDGDKLVLRSHFSLEKWHYVTSSFTLLPYFSVFFCFVLLLFWVEQLQETQTLGFLKTKKKSVYWFLNLSFPKAGYTWSCLGIFFAATALPPNGIDQRLLHCSLPLCLCSESAHC